MDPRQELEMLRRLAQLEAKAGRPVQSPSVQATPEAINPAEGMSALERGLVGAGGAVRKAYLGVRSLVPGLGLTPQEQEELKWFEGQKDNLGTAGTVGGVLSDVAMMAVPGGAAQRAIRGASTAAQSVPLLGRALAATRTGIGSAAAAGGALSAATAPEDRGEAALGGAIGAGAGEAAGRVLTKALGGVVSNKVTPQARELMDQGASVPMWKAVDQTDRAGRVIRNLAERGRVLPVAGDLIKTQERAGIESWNKILMREATPPTPTLDEAGGVLRWNVKPVESVGTKGMNELAEKFDSAYGALYGNRGVPVDDQFKQSLAGIVADTQKYMPSAADDVGGAAKRVLDTLAGPTAPNVQKTGGSTVGRGKVSSRITTPVSTTETPGREVISHDALKQAIKDLDKSVQGAWQKGDAEKAEALDSMRQALLDMRARGLPPEVASEAQAINQAYAKFKTLERAAGTLGAQKAGGVVTPAQQLNAIRARDRTPDKSAFARGNAPGQRQALTANDVYGSTLPEVGPGTAEKLLPFVGLGLPMMGMDMGATALLGTQTGQRFLMGGLPGQQPIRRLGNEYLIPALRAYGTAMGN